MADKQKPKTGSTPTVAAAPPHRASSPRPQRAASIVLAVALVLLGLWVLQGFLASLVWAAIFAIATWPLYVRFCRLRFRPGRTLTALLFTVLVGIVLVGPLALIAIELGHEGFVLLHWLQKAQHDGVPMPDWVARLPFVSAYVTEWWQANLTDPHAASALLGRLQGRLPSEEWTRTLGAQVLRRSTILGFTLLALFFLYRDGTVVTKQLTMAADRLFGPTGQRLGKSVISAVRGTVNGLVLVGLGEGVLLGIAYAVFGLSHPASLAAATGIIAIFPFGVVVITAVAAFALFVEASVGAAIGLFAFGMVIAFIADHFVRPVLIGGTTKLPFLWVLLGLLGGLESFGLLGLFLGPAVMAALMALWREWLVV